MLWHAWWSLGVYASLSVVFVFTAPLALLPFAGKLLGHMSSAIELHLQARKGGKIWWETMALISQRPTLPPCSADGGRCCGQAPERESENGSHLSETNLTTLLS